MTNLVIDIGNTQFKLCVFQNQELSYHAYYNSLEPVLLLSLISEFQIERGIFSDTRGIETDFLSKLLPDHFELMELSYKTPLPIELNYETPETLGKDRIAGAVGGFVQFPQTPLLIVDIGTAITIDFISADGVFQGGIISPGPATRYKALHQFTGKLPLLEPINEPPLIGKSTTGSIQAGVQQGILHEINGYINQYQKIHPSIKVVLTGGYAYLFDKKINFPVYSDAFLIPKGLNHIAHYQLNQ
jgi:type III pantothenate kinase